MKVLASVLAVINMVIPNKVCHIVAS